MTLGRPWQLLLLLGVGLLQPPAFGQAYGRQGMVTSAHPLASQTGLAILKQGGNAVDAAVATTFAISVVEPFSAGIGGGGFLLLRQNQTGAIRSLDFRERAPLLADRNLYLDARGQVKPNLSRDGYLAVATPGTIAGLYEVHQRYGKLAWPLVVKPAARLARKGLIVSPRLATAIASRRAILNNPAGRAIFAPGGKPLQTGDRLIQADLATTLDTLAKQPQDFYSGNLAQVMARDMANQGGLITLKDLEHYRPIWRSPVCGNFRVYRICSMPPPSSGGVHLLQMLNLVEDLDFKGLGWHQPAILHRLIAAMRIAYADRAVYLGDPNFVSVPVPALISPAYARLRLQQIDPVQARPFSQLGAADPATLQRLMQESSETSHLNVVDREKNAVSLTFTVNLGFGAGVVVPGTGIILNNEMDDFAIAPDTPNAFGLVGGDANAIEPGKTPLSSMTPTIVTQNQQLRLVTGSPGGSRIITTVLQVVLNVLAYEMDIQSAIAASRLHHQWFPDRLYVERWGFDALTLADLERRGYQVQVQSAWGNASGIVQNPNGRLEGAADPRGEGTAEGY